MIFLNKCNFTNQTREIQEIISTAYKHSFEGSELKKLFFSECKPFQLEEQNAEQVKVKEDILESIKLQQYSLKGVCKS